TSVAPSPRWRNGGKIRVCGMAYTPSSSWYSRYPTSSSSTVISKRDSDGLSVTAVVIGPSSHGCSTRDMAWCLVAMGRMRQNGGARYRSLWCPVDERRWGRRILEPPGGTMSIPTRGVLYVHSAPSALCPHVE